MARAGRKSAYYTKVEPRLDEVRKWRVDEGQTEINIAKLLGISYRSLMEYKVKFPQFAQVLKESKQALIGEMEKTLFQLAKGGYKVRKIKNIYELNRRTNKMELVKTEEQIDEVAPNTTATIFALKNLDHTKWRDRRVLDMEEAQDNHIAKNLEILTNIVRDGEEDGLS